MAKLYQKFLTWWTGETGFERGFKKALKEPFNGN